MSREVRMVPPDWQHPKYPDDHYPDHLRGRYVALSDGGYEQAAADWDEGFRKWREGLYEDYSSSEKWSPIPAELANRRYSEWAGECPSPDDYMPEWPAELRTHLMMYETTSEGTPISPAFSTPEELAHWLADNNASAFGSSGASYESWLSACKRGWSMSAVWTPDSGLVSGVEALAEQTP